MAIAAPERPLALRGFVCLALGGCAVLEPADIPEPVDPPPPTLLSVDLQCHRDADQWVLEAETDAWTAGVRLTWTADGEVIESHVARSVEAAADGSADRVRLVLQIVADPRDVVANSTTRYLCADPVGGVLEALALDEEPSDCLPWGLDPDRVAAVVTCE